MDEWAVVSLVWAVLAPVVLVVVVVAVAAFVRECGRDEFGRPGQSGPTPARDLVDLAGGQVPRGR